MKRRYLQGSTSAEYVVVMFALVAVLLIAFSLLERIRDYHTRSSQAMEIPL